MNDVLLVTGAGQISMAIARRVGYGKKIVVGDKNLQNRLKFEKIMSEAGFDIVSLDLDLASKTSILEFIKIAKTYGEVTLFVNGGGVSPSQASIEEILKVDLYGTAVLLDEIGKIIHPSGAGVTISSQSGYRMPALTTELDEKLACTVPDKLLEIKELQIKNVQDPLHAYQLAKRCNGKRVMAEAVKWGKKKARINAISPGIIVTPLALDEFSGPRGEFYKNMFKNSPSGRPGTADEVANVAELLLSEKGGFITGSDFLIDGGATAAYFYADKK